MHLKTGITALSHDGVHGQGNFVHAADPDINLVVLALFQDFVQQL